MLCFSKMLFFFFASFLHGPALRCFLSVPRRSSTKGFRMTPVDSGMGVEDWENRYKVPDAGVLDDYLDAEQKKWEDDDKSIIYHINKSPSESKGSRFYQTVECDMVSPEDPDCSDDTSVPGGRTPGFGSGEVRLVYKEAGSFEDEFSPPEIDIIPSVKKLRQQTDGEGLLYKTRLWAKTAFEGTLESYAAFQREEAARVRSEYGSIGSDEMRYSFGSEEELDDLTFIDGDVTFEYESYYYPEGYDGQENWGERRAGHGQDPLLSVEVEDGVEEEPIDEYIDAMGELQNLVHSVSEYLAVKEEEINNYESLPKPIRRKLPEVPTDVKADTLIAKPEVEDKNNEHETHEQEQVEVKEESTVEQGIVGVKNAMSSLLSTTSSKPSAELPEVLSTSPSTPPVPPQTDSGISKLLSFIPKPMITRSNPSTELPEALSTSPSTSPVPPQTDSGISKLLSFIPKPTITRSNPSTELPKALSTSPSTSPVPQTDSGISKLLSFIPKPSGEAKDGTVTVVETSTSHAPSTTETSLSKLLSFIPKTGGFSPPVAIVPPASQEPTIEKKFTLQSFLPFQSSESSHPAEAGQSSQGSESTSNQPASVVDSVLGRLSPMRLFSSAPTSQESSPQPAEQRSSSATSTESRQGSIDRGRNLQRSHTEQQPSGEGSGSVEFLPGSGSGSVELLPGSGRVSVELLPGSGSGSMELLPGSGSGSVDLLPGSGSGSVDLLPGSGSGSVELLPETESSGELPDIKQRITSGVSEPKPESSTEDTGFFSPFKKSLSSLISTSGEIPQQVESKSTEESFLGSKLKMFSSEKVSAQAPKAEEGMFSGILKFASGEDNASKSTPPSPTRTQFPSRSALLESVPKGNAETGWFSNLFKVTPSDPVQQPMQTQSPPTVTLTKPSGQTETHAEPNSPEIMNEAESPKGQTLPGASQCPTDANIDALSKDHTPEQVKSQPEQHAPQQPQGLLAGLLKLGSTEDVNVGGNAQGAASQPQQGGPFSGLFSSLPQTSPQAQPGSEGVKTVGFLSGFLKMATDTVSGPQPPHAKPGSSPIDEQSHKEGPEPASTQGAVPPSQQGYILSELHEADCLDKGYPEKQLQKPATPELQSNQQQLSDQTTKRTSPNVEAAPSPGGFFGGLFKGTEVLPQQSSPDAQTSQPTSVLSGLFNKIVEPTLASPQPQSGPGSQSSSQGLKQPQEGGFLSGLFGSSGPDSASVNQAPPRPQQDIGPPGNRANQQSGNRQNLQRQKPIPAQQQPAGPGGILSGLFNRIADAPQPPESQPAPLNQQGGFLSGLFSMGPTPSAQQQKPDNKPNQQQTHQGNRQPLQRQNQIPPQLAASVSEPQQGGLLSGIFSKLTPTDNTPQQPTLQTGLQGNKTNTPVQAESAIQQESHPSQQGRFFSSPQQAAANQQTSQSGGFLSGFLKLASNENESQPTQTGQAPVKQGQDAPKSESGGLLSGLLSKISATEEEPSPIIGQKPQLANPQQQARAGQGRPQIQRTRPVELQSSQDVTANKDSKNLVQKGFLSGLFNASDETPTSKAPIAQPCKEEPKTSTSSTSNSTTPGLLSNILKSGNGNDNNLATADTEKGLLSRLLSKGREDVLTSATTATSETTCIPDKAPQPSQIFQDPTIYPTQRYLEEIQRLLYGTAEEYGYQDLLYNFAEHGVIPSELYEHQCLIEALLWQQLNDYALAEALDAQVHDCYQVGQGYMPPTVVGPVWENPGCLDPKQIDTSQFNIPSHPWRDSASQMFETKNRFLDPEEDLVLFDMSFSDRKSWSSCDHLNDLDKNRKPWIVSAVNLSTKKPRTKLSRCQSLNDCVIPDFSSVVGKSDHNSVETDKKDLNLQSATEFLKRLAAKRGPMDLTHGAMDLSRTTEMAGDEDVLFEDSEWYQQWISLLDQGMWWPAEAGDCGYYVYTDEEYIYSLLTDKAGKHLYTCATPEDMHVLGTITENIANALKHKENKETLCGFKIPLCNEDEGLWIPGQQHNSQLLGDPMDLTSVFRKGDKIMNMNLESFSQMFQESISSQLQQPVDFTLYTLKKIKIEEVQNGYSEVQNGCSEVQNGYCDKSLDATDLTLKILKESHRGPYLKSQRSKDNISPSSTTPRASPCFYKQPVPPIPQIKIQHVDKNPENMPQNKSSFLVSTVTSNTPKSPSASFKVSEVLTATKKVQEPTPASKIPVTTQSGRKLPATQNDCKTPLNPPLKTPSSKILPSASAGSPCVTPQRAQLTRQPSRAQSSAAMPQATIASVLSTSTANQDHPSTSEHPQSLPQKRKPQLHILNDTPVMPFKVCSHNRVEQSSAPPDSQLGNRALDCSSKEKNIKAKEASPAIPQYTVTTKDQVIDFTKYKCKRIKERMQKEVDAGRIETDNGQHPVINLTKKVEEDEVEWADMEYTGILSQARPNGSIMRDVSPQITPKPNEQHNTLQRRLPILEKTIGDTSSRVQCQTPTLPHRASLTNESNQVGPRMSVSNAMDTPPRLSLTHSDRSESSTAGRVPGSLIDSVNARVNNNRVIQKQSSSTSPLVTPVIRQQVELDRQNVESSPAFQMQPSHPVLGTKPLRPTISDRFPVGCKEVVFAQAPSETSRPSGSLHKPQEVTTPANLVKSTLDMSAKAPPHQPQQTIYQSHDLKSNALSLKNKKPLNHEDAKQRPYSHGSIDLRAVPPEKLGQTPEYVQTASVQEISHFH